MISSSKIKNKWNLYVFEAQKCHESFVMHSFFSETKFVETDRIDIATLQKKKKKLLVALQLKVVE